MLDRAEAQSVYGIERESHNERTRNTLKQSTCSHKWWETLRGSIIGKKPSISALREPGGGFMVAPAEKTRHSWALSLTASSVKSSSSYLCLVSLNLGAILWPSGLLSFCICFLILTRMVVFILWACFLISNDGCGYYCYKIKNNFSWAIHPGLFSECWRSTNVTAISNGATNNQ